MYVAFSLLSEKNENENKMRLSFFCVCISYVHSRFVFHNTRFILVSFISIQALYFKHNCIFQVNDCSSEYFHFKQSLTLDVFLCPGIYHQSAPGQQVLSLQACDGHLHPETFCWSACLQVSTPGFAKNV